MVAQKQATTWLARSDWQVVLVQNIDGIVAMDTLSFTSPNQISSTHHPNPGVIAGPNPWGSWSPTPDPNRITGQTVKGSPFYIEYIENPRPGSGPDWLTCYMDQPKIQKHITVVLGTVAGALTGAGLGLALHNTLVGALAGSVAGAISAILLLLSGSGPNATWVATDGGAGAQAAAPQPMAKSA
jgi:hypothetical protein